MAAHTSDVMTLKEAAEFVRVSVHTFGDEARDGLGQCAGIASRHDHQSPAQRRGRRNRCYRHSCRPSVQCAQPCPQYTRPKVPPRSGFSYVSDRVLGSVCERAQHQGPAERAHRLFAAPHPDRHTAHPCPLPLRRRMDLAKNRRSVAMLTSSRLRLNHGGKAAHRQADDRRWLLSRLAK